jgi:hypothetical protein
LPGFTSKLSMFQTEVMLKDNEYWVQIRNGRHQH